MDGQRDLVTSVDDLLRERDALTRRIEDLEAQVSDLRDSLDSVCEFCQDRCRCKGKQA